MHAQIRYRKGTLGELRNLSFAKELSLSRVDIEFNIVAMGHEFWIATESNCVIGLVALASSEENQFTVMYLTVADPRKRQGIGSSLLRTVLENYPAAEFRVVPLEGSEELYSRLGFERRDRWEMRRASPAPKSGSTI
jgi:predicted N-acetyltransferase YhbS